MIEPDGSIRCDGCNKKFGEYTQRGLRIVCGRCHRYNFFDLTKEYLSHKLLAMIKKVR